MLLKINHDHRRRWITAGVVVLAGGLAVSARWSASGSTATQPARQATAWAWLQPGAGTTASEVVADTPSPRPADVRSPDTLRAVLYQGSFSGTQAFGSWCARTASTLTPCLGLRERFEYYINGLGEISVAEVRALIEDEARKANGAQLAQQIMAIYDKYWDVRNHTYRHNVDMADISSWMPALQEAQQYRKQILGEDWAKAFYAEDDQEFIATYQRASTGSPPPPSSSDPVPLPSMNKDAQAIRSERMARYGAEVTAQLEALDAQQGQFDQQVALARAEWSRLQAQPNLSELDRDAQLHQFISTHFDAHNRKRATALARLPAP